MCRHPNATVKEVLGNLMRYILWLISLVNRPRQGTGQKSLSPPRKDFHVWATTEILWSHLTNVNIFSCCACVTLIGNLRSEAWIQRRGSLTLQPEPTECPSCLGWLSRPGCSPEQGGRTPCWAVKTQSSKGAGSCKPVNQTGPLISCLLSHSPHSRPPLGSSHQEGAQISRKSRKQTSPTELLSAMRSISLLHQESHLLFPIGCYMVLVKVTFGTCVIYVRYVL